MNTALIRFARNALALMATGAVCVYQNDPRYILIAPLINAVAKYLRVKYGVKYLIF